LIEADKLHKLFGAFTAVREVSLNVDDGEVVALLGPNGAGKTTTVRMLAAILKPTSGRALIAGYDVVEQAREARHVVGLLTEYPGLYNRMRPMEYLQFFGALQGMTAIESEKRGRLLLQQFGLWESREKRLDSYSKGMKQKVALIRALIHDPQVLFLDEPTTAMDPHSARTVRDAIAELRAARNQRSRPLASISRRSISGGTASSSCSRTRRSRSARLAARSSAGCSCSGSMPISRSRGWPVKSR